MQDVHFQSQQPRGWVSSEDLGSLTTIRSLVDCILYLINQVKVYNLFSLCYLGPVVSKKALNLEKGDIKTGM